MIYDVFVVHKESTETLIEQGGFFRTFSFDLLIEPLLCFLLNLMEHLRFVKGLQHHVFELGGELCVHKGNTNTLV